MNLEQQVISLELAKKLKELGVKQESLFWWENRKDVPAYWDEERMNRDEYWHIKFGEVTDYELILKEKSGHREFYSAFTVAELGEMLPAMLKYKYKPDEDMFWLDCEKSTEDWRLCYRQLGKFEYFRIITGAHETSILEVVADTETDARAKMLIYLIENKLITL